MRFSTGAGASLAGPNLVRPLIFNKKIRKRHTDSPVTERMVLFWRNHFTSSLEKVKWPAFLCRQNLLMRRHAVGNFRSSFAGSRGLREWWGLKAPFLPEKPLGCIV